MPNNKAKAQPEHPWMALICVHTQLGVRQRAVVACVPHRIAAARLYSLELWCRSVRSIWRR